MNNAVDPKVYEIVKKAVNGDLENFEISVQDPNKKGEGYLGQIFFISLKNKDDGKQLHLAVKQAFSDKTIRDFGNIREIFLNEIYFYSKVWPKLLKFQERIPKAYHFDHIAKCLATISEERFERLVLENLKYQGFVMHDKKKPLDREQFELIFRIYGRFHAMSFAYKALHPEEFSEMVGKFYPIFAKFYENESFTDVNKYTHEQCLEHLQPGVDDEVIEKYKHYVDDGVQLFKNTLVNGKYTALIHGDCWSNNMMFKYDDSGKLVDVRFLDFQLAREGSPVCDLSYCLYCASTKDILDDLDHFLHVYHDSLSDNLRAYGCDPNEVYPLEALKNDWKVYCQLGVTMGLSIWRGKLIYDDEVVDFTDITEESEEGMQKFKDAKYDVKTYKERTREILLHLYDNDYLL